MMRTRLRAPGCPTTPSYPKNETSMGSSAGFKTSMSNSQRIITNCILHTVNSLMGLRTITTNSIIPLLQTQSSSAKTLPKALLLDYQTRCHKHKVQEGSDLTSELVRCMKLNQNLEAQCTLHLSFSTMIKPTSTELSMMSKRVSRTMDKSHS